MLTYEGALQRLLRSLPSPQVTSERLQEALGLVLARPVRARLDLPRFDNSAVDGYAIHAGDPPAQTTGGPALALCIVGESQAGHPFQGTVQAGQAVRIFTGAQVPQGAQAVVMQEHAQRLQDHVLLRLRPQVGQHIRRRGEDVRRGTQVLTAGTRLRAQEIGLLAALGCVTASVYRRPVVAILVTGDEVRPPGVRLTAGQIYESNGVLLEALAHGVGARSLRLGIAGDAMRPLLAAIRRGLSSDLLVIAGGVSVGEKDIVRQALRCAGVRPIFWQVNIKPGMPLFFGRRGRTLVFGLPGNPVSTFVTFEEFVRPALSRLMGWAWRDPYTTPATLTQDLKTSQTRRTHFLRVRCAVQDGHIVAHPLNGQGSHHLRTLVEADGWIRVNAEQGPWRAGTRVLVKRETI
jgi:molybdopterin molybdotransferase